MHMIARIETTMFETDGIMKDDEKTVAKYYLFLLHEKSRSSDGQEIAAMDFDIGQDGDGAEDVADWKP